MAEDTKIQQTNPEGLNDQANNPAENGAEGTEQATTQDLLSQIAQLKADATRNKNALDKALKEKGDLTKQLRARMNAEEQEQAAKAEAEEARKAYISELEGYKQKNEAKERYLLQGMSPELAIKAAEAEVTGDMDALADIQKQHTDALIKAKEAEWKKSRPALNAGEGGTTMTKEEIHAIKDPVERQRRIAENLALYD